MNAYVTGNTIRTICEKRKLTQSELARRLCVSDKTISKWETGKGLPDISMLEPLAEALHISVTELISGMPVVNRNRAANLMKSVVHVCPVCGNVQIGTGEAGVQCHGIQLPSLIGEPVDSEHSCSIRCVEDEYHIQMTHEMTRSHSISFIAGIGQDRIQLVHLYPEGSCETRMKRDGIRRIVFYCTRDGLFEIPVSGRL
ncbi:MAG: helix-turn-helix domain-containing protein [Bulleidia sp.]